MMVTMKRSNSGAGREGKRTKFHAEDEDEEKSEPILPALIAAPERNTPLFSLDAELVCFTSDSLTQGISLAQRIIMTSRFGQCLFEMSDGDIDPIKVKEFIERNNFVISPITQRDMIDSCTYACVYGNDYPLSIFLNPLLLYQMLRFENQSKLHEQHQSASSSSSSSPAAPVASTATTQIQKNAFFIAVKICHEFSHLAHLACGVRLTDMTQPKKVGGEGKRKQNNPSKTIDGSEYTDFGDMMENKLFGCVIRLFHEKERFGIQDIVAIYDPKKLFGFRILLEQKNFDVDDELSNIRVNHHSEKLTDRDGSPSFQYKDNEDNDDDGEEDDSDDDSEEFDYSKLSTKEQLRRGFIRT